MPNRVKIDISTSTIVKIALAILAVWFLYAVHDVAVLFFIVLIIVAALNPLVDWAAKYIPRFLAVIFLAVIIIGIFALIGIAIIPPLIVQLTQMANNLPALADRFGPFYHTIQSAISQYQEGLLNLTSQLSGVTTGIYSTTIGFFSGVVAFFTILVMAFYMLLEQDAIRSYINQIISPEQKDRVFPILKKIVTKMGNWLRGQFSLMVIVGVLDGIALAILGVPYALILAIWGGLTEAVPYIGPWLGLIPAVIIAFTMSPIKALIVVVAYLVIQQLEAQFLVPKIMGKALGLSPVIIILAILIGAKLLGILGVIVAVPMAAAVSVVIQEWPEIRKLYNRG